MRKLLILVFYLFALSAQTQSFPVHELLEKNYQASKPRVEIHSYIIRTMLFFPDSQVVHMDKIYKSGDKIRINTSTGGGGNTVRAFNGKTAWRRDINGQIKILDKKGTQEMRFIAATSNPNNKLSDYFEKISLAKQTENINSEPCFKLTCTPFPRYGQMPAIYYISTREFLVRRTDTISLHQSSPLPMTSLYLNYKNFKGLMLPAETNTITLHGPVVSKIISVQINPELKGREFEPSEQNSLPWKK